jgi:hypothetical protein
MHGDTAASLSVRCTGSCLEVNPLCRLGALAAGSMVNLLAATGVQTIAIYFTSQLGRSELSATVLATALSRAIGELAYSPSLQWAMQAYQLDNSQWYN